MEYHDNSRLYNNHQYLRSTQAFTAPYHLWSTTIIRCSVTIVTIYWVPQSFIALWNYHNLWNSTIIHGSKAITIYRVPQSLTAIKQLSPFTWYHNHSQLYKIYHHLRGSTIIHSSTTIITIYGVPVTCCTTKVSPFTVSQSLGAPQRLSPFTKYHVYSHPYGK